MDTVPAINIHLHTGLDNKLSSHKEQNENLTELERVTLLAYKNIYKAAVSILKGNVKALNIEPRREAG